jgi:hypothetical protein
MTKPKRGGCQCGLIRYEINKEPVGLAVCHCRKWQQAGHQVEASRREVPIFNCAAAIFDG